MRDMKRTMQYLTVAGLLASGIAAADAAVNAQNVVINSTNVLQAMQKSGASNQGIPPDVIRNAAAIAIIPEVRKSGGFFGGGGRHGVGVLAVRKLGGGWSDPVFVNFHADSASFNNKAPSANVVAVFMNANDLRPLLNNNNNGGGGGGSSAGANNGTANGGGSNNGSNSGNNGGGIGGFFGGGKGNGITLGSNGVPVTAGPLGGPQRQPAGLNTTGVYTYSEANGALSGVALTGAQFDIAQNANQNYYGNNIAPDQIVAGNGVKTTQYTHDLVTAIEQAEQGGASGGGSGTAPSGGGSTGGGTLGGGM